MEVLATCQPQSYEQCRDESGKLKRKTPEDDMKSDSESELKSR